MKPALSCRAQKNQGAFSLLELSVVLVIISLIVAFGFSAGQNAIEGSDRVTTQQRLNSIQTALENFVAQNGYLPCPSQRNLTPSSASFGLESRSGTACTVTGDIKSLPAGTPVIYLGGVPVRTLGLPDAYAADAWSDKFLYAVSLNHVGSMAAYLNSDGPITINYGDRTTHYAVTTTRSCTSGKNCTAGAMATYVVLSHGPDGKGAYPLYGTAVGTACGSGTIDSANCDEINSSMTSDNAYHANFYDTAYNDSVTNAANFFDDYIVWGTDALGRSTLTVPTGVCSNTLISGGSGSGTGICQESIPTCNAACVTAGYSGGSTTLSNCFSDSACTSNLRCDYQCCCSGTLSGGCAPKIGITWSGATAGCSGDLQSSLTNGGSTVIYNGVNGYTGHVTLNCAGGVITNGSIMTTICTTGSSGGCSSSSCDNWCAPCTLNGGSPSQQKLCQKTVISASPCGASCIWAGCSSSSCTACP